MLLCGALNNQLNFNPQLAGGLATQLSALILVGGESPEFNGPGETAPSFRDHPFATLHELARVTEGIGIPHTIHHYRGSLSGSIHECQMQRVKYRSTGRGQSGNE